MIIVVTHHARATVAATTIAVAVIRATQTTTGAMTDATVTDDRMPGVAAINIVVILRVIRAITVGAGTIGTTVGMEVATTTGAITGGQAGVARAEGAMNEEVMQTLAFRKPTQTVVAVGTKPVMIPTTSTQTRPMPAGTTCCCFSFAVDFSLSSSCANAPSQFLFSPHFVFVEVLAAP
jgi:hypothetical protein